RFPCILHSRTDGKRCIPAIEKEFWPFLPRFSSHQQPCTAAHSCWHEVCLSISQYSCTVFWVSRIDVPRALHQIPSRCYGLGCLIPALISADHRRVRRWRTCGDSPRWDSRNDG